MSVQPLEALSIVLLIAVPVELAVWLWRRR
jgi:hypothetical protein